MNARCFTFAAVALLATSVALAAAPERKPAEPQSVVRERTLLEELAEGARDLLRAAVPEVTVPALELTLPKLDRDPR